LLSGIVSLGVLASFAIPLWLTMRGTHITKHEIQSPAYYAVLFAFYAVSYFVVIFFNCALVWCAHENLSGRPVTFNQGLHMAVKSLPQIILWSLIASTVGTILRSISERAGLIGQVVIAIVGMVWSLATFFVVPLLIVERQTALKALKGSSSMLKKTWGERVIGNAGISLVTVMLMLLGFIPIIIGVVIYAQTDVFLPLIGCCMVALVYWLALATISAALSGIYQTALYIYASTGRAPAAFSDDFIRQAFIEKPQRKVFGRSF
jgi:hypothetical protein